MWSFGMSAAQRRDLQAALDGNHNLRVRVYVLDMEHQPLDDVSGLLVDGQVDFDVSRGESSESGSGGGSISSATVTLQDPARTLDFVRDSPSELNTSAARMLRIFYCVRRPTRPGHAAPEWHEIPVFTGPITGSRRVDSEVRLDCESKEHVWRHTVHGRKTWPKGTPAREVLTTLYNLAGEPSSNIRIAQSQARIPSAWSIDFRDDLWLWAQKAAEVMDMHLFFNGWGAMIATPRRVFASGADIVFDTTSNVTSIPSGSLQVETDLRNRWMVTGQGGEDGKGPFGYANLPRDHPLSAWSLGRYGTARAYDEHSSPEWVKTNEQARASARSQRDSAMNYNPLQVQFSGLPHPELEPWDIVRVQTPYWGQEFKLGAWTIPLKAGESASYGANKKVSVMRQKGQPKRKTARYGRSPQPVPRKRLGG